MFTGTTSDCGKEKSFICVSLEYRTIFWALSSWPSESVGLFLTVVQKRNKALFAFSMYYTINCKGAARDKSNRILATGNKSSQKTWTKHFISQYKFKLYQKLCPNLQGKPDGSIQKIRRWWDKGLTESEKCPRLLTHLSPAPLNATPREEARLEEGDHFRGWLPEDED